jgi:hypothetical protein
LKTPFCHIIKVTNEKNSIITIIFHPKYNTSFLRIQLSSQKMPVEEYKQMDGEDLIKEEFTNTELVDMALKVVEASPSNLDLNVGPISNVDDQPPPIVKLTDA